MSARVRAAAVLAVTLLASGCSAPSEPTLSPGGSGVSPGNWWRPAQGLTWDIQLTSQNPAAATSAVLDLDGADTTAETVRTLRARGVRTLCYFNAGGWEDWRADKAAFPAAVIGKPLDNWPGEKWLDVRQRDALMPIMEKRVQDCADKGFDAVDPDNLDGWGAKSGFSLTKADAAAYEMALADAAHRRGLGVGLKNAMDLLPAVGGAVDFAVNEQCAQYKECDVYSDFLASGKAVFHVEYKDTAASCAGAQPGMSTIVKHLKLDPWVHPC